jgi:hypothetical protein
MIEAFILDVEGGLQKLEREKLRGGRQDVKSNGY